MSHESRMEAAKFNMTRGSMGIPNDNRFVCGLGVGVSEAKCYLYIKSGSTSCRQCMAHLNRVQKAILAGSFTLCRAPIINFFLTAMTGKPGIAEDLLKLRQRQAFRAAKNWNPLPREELVRRDGERKLRKAMEKVKEQPKPQEKAYHERVIVKEETIDPPPAKPKARRKAETAAKSKPVIQRRRKKAVWMGTCEKCKRKNVEIVAWGECGPCLNGEEQ